ncbi:phosphatidylserine decarboxylase [Pedosphaera parvula]|uniref:Phosphatidylserine decarboxylase related protein n=1 Tax=Pedosphaera parvula (strain Ellin514) TaxID=320771 RepID=B9XRG1_PEDPL|nr:phosphatidylserine decarboxylase [Pedosphaera parvula]EEF57595.1 phosphatidylserine decarboxylase related protein [Pedosphaera parvula Ellin514]
MRHSGKARKAAFKMIFWTLVALGVIFVAGALAAMLGTFILGISIFLVALWGVFALFTLYFFRDPEAKVPTGPDLIVSPSHGVVDTIDEIDEPKFMGGRCQRISVFLSVLNVHVQNAPIAGKVAYYKYTNGQFLNAMKTESATHNENAYIGFESTDHPGEKLGLRLIAGVLARRIVPFVNGGDEVARGERISLIQFGSRTDIYLPLSAKINVKLRDKVVGGETIIGKLE